MKHKGILIKGFYLSTLLFILICGCKQKQEFKLSDEDILHENQDLLTKVIIYDVFSPPVASRIYVYSSLASYEAIRFNDKSKVSIVEKLHGFETMPKPEAGKNYNFTLAATQAFFTVVRNVKVFSVDSLTTYENSIYNNYKQILDKSTYKQSIDFGNAVAHSILLRAKNDNYLKTRGDSKYLGSETMGNWRPTPPDYSDGLEPNWNEIKLMALDSASQFIPQRPPAFSTDTTSNFYKIAKEVWIINKNLTDEQKMIAKYWDDNPFVTEHYGHLKYATKKITPGGHWMGIAAIAAKQTHANPVNIAQTYALTAIALFDAFIVCWDEKYRSHVIRPITVINELIDKNFTPFLQTPPFPEYTSGHSAISASAAEVLSQMYGNNFSFLDTSDLKYIGMKRQFNSFKEAANEVSISRVYGGIHYRTGVDEGAKQGSKVGKFIIKKVLME